MEGARFLLAIGLSIVVVILVNVLFPPAQPPQGTRPDSAAVRIDTGPAGGDVARPGAAGTAGTGQAGAGEVDTAGRGPSAGDPGSIPGGADSAGLPAAAGPATGQGGAPEDTVWVETDVARYGLSTRGAGLVSVELLDFASYTRDGPVQLAEPGSESLLSYALRIGDRVIPLGTLDFRPSIAPGDTARAGGDPLAIAFRAAVNGGEVEIRYTFAGERYLVGVEGDIGALASGDGTLLFGLGPRLAVNEADSAEDLRALAYVVNSRRDGIESVRITDMETDRIEEGPLSWVALKNKYFLAALLPPPGSDIAFGGVIAAAGPPGTGTSSVDATLPLDRSGAFDIRLFFGPQEYGRLSAIGTGLEDVNPYGWRIFRPIIRPLAHVIAWMLEGLHDVLNLGYGWVLILFGFAMRGLMWPLNAKAMRSQLKTMELQPRIKEIQAKYKDKPELLQKEMVRLYKEEGFNPLGGCLPMLVPWPVLITLFFVFQNTIEFRGVDFLWLPDLSRPDPLYLLPVLLGLSLFVTQWMNLRAAPQDNPQMKMMMWMMPIVMVVIFLNFASGLNLYYAASNVAGIPQQVQIIRERGRARARLDARKKE